MLSGQDCNSFYMIMAIALIPLPIKADNQLIPGNEGTSDPAPMVEGNKVYLYCTVDAIGNGDLQFMISLVTPQKTFITEI